MAAKPAPKKNALWEAIKAITRLLILAIPGIVVAYLSGLASTPTILAITAALHFVDNYIHNNPKIKATGIIPF